MSVSDKILKYVGKSFYSSDQKKITISKYIASGSFGNVYEAKDDNDNKYAIKIPTNKKNCKKWLLQELDIYNDLNKDKDLYDKFIGIANVDTINDGSQKYIIMDLLGPSLDSLLQCNKKFSLKTILLLMIQILQVVKYIHDNGYIHRDIKPDNFVMDNTDKNKLYCIDFGLAKKYVKNNGEHNPFKNNQEMYKKIKNLCKKYSALEDEDEREKLSREIKKIKLKLEQRKDRFCGTARYASIAAHDGEEQSRKDDLESIGYMMVYLFNGKLPWQNIKHKEKKKRYNLIRDKKKEISIEELCDKLPIQFVSYFNYVKRLDYDERPLYSSLIKLFRDLFISKNYTDDKFDWEVETNLKT